MKINIVKETEAAKDVERYLRYDPNTGEFVWAKPTVKHVKPGDTAGYLNLEGYINIRYNHHLFRAHRLAWFFTYGYFPENHVDHVNGVRDDNRITNLREVSHSCNLQNQKIRINNTSGITGVYFNNNAGKWQAQIKIPNKFIYLGLYRTKLDAALARLNAELVLEDWTCDATTKTYKAIKELWPQYECPVLEAVG